MKKLSTATKVALCLILAGLSVSIFSIFWIHFDFTRVPEHLGSEPGDLTKIEYKVENPDQLHTLNLKTSNVKVVVKESGNSDLIVTYYEAEDITYTRTLENGTLNITKDDKFRIDLFNFNFHIDDGVTVAIPRDLKINLAVDTSNSRIESKDELSFDNLKLTTSNSKIELENASAGRIELKTSNGQISLGNLKTSSEITADTRNSRINAWNNSAIDRVYLKTSNGRIEIESQEAKKVELKTSNSRISGSFTKSEDAYNYDLKTSNSKIRMNNQDRGKSYYQHGNDTKPEIFAHTSNGEIDLEFN